MPPLERARRAAVAALLLLAVTSAHAGRFLDPQLPDESGGEAGLASEPVGTDGPAHVRGRILRDPLAEPRAALANASQPAGSGGTSGAAAKPGDDDDAPDKTIAQARADGAVMRSGLLAVCYRKPVRRRPRSSHRCVAAAEVKEGANRTLC